MNNQSLAVLFPGQGAYYAGVLAESYRLEPPVRQIFDTVDSVAHEMLQMEVTGAIWGETPAGIEHLLAHNPDALQLSMFATSVAAFQILEARRMQPGVLAGHSFGEIAALVCAGAFTVREGAEIVCHRVLALRSVTGTDGYMAALSTDAHRTGKILDLVGNQKAVIAVENYSGQTVISGQKAALDAIAQLCRILQISFIQLNSPYPFHSPLMHPAVADFAARLRHLRPRPLRYPVYSAILGRYYRPGDDLGACLAEHLVLPVRFMDAIRQLHADGASFFIECGALDTLGKLTRRVLGQAEPVTIASLNPRLGDEKSIETAVETLKAYNLISEQTIIDIDERETLMSTDNSAGMKEMLNGMVETLIPGMARSTFEAFWSERGSQVIAYAMEEFEDFMAANKETLLATLNEALPVLMTASAPAPAVGAIVAPTAPAVVQAPATMATTNGSAPAATQKISREQLFKELAAMYAEALEYPEEVFTGDVELEAELGIDSVKQTELMARVSERYSLPPRPADFRMSDYHTLGKVADFVYRMQGQGESAAAVQTATPAPAVQVVQAPAVQAVAPVATTVTNGSAPAPANKISREQLFKELAAMYAEALEYPEEVFTEDVELEAELGIDSVKQTELMARVSERYSLPPRPADFRMSDYHTLGKVADFVYRMQGQGAGLALASAN